MSALNGFSYFYENVLGLDVSEYLIHYNFKATGANNVLNVASGVQDPNTHSLLVNDVNNLIVSGSGNFSNFGYPNSPCEISGANSLNSQIWTMFFIYERNTTGNDILFSSFTGNNPYSGFVLGINPANKLYFESYDQNGPTIKTSQNIYGSKNAIAVTQSFNSLTFHYYNFNTTSLISENFIINSNVIPSGPKWYLGGAPQQPSQILGTHLNGFMDEFIYIKDSLNINNLQGLFSGFYSQLSGINQVVETIHTTGITGVAVNSGEIYAYTGFEVNANSGSGACSPFSVTYTTTPIKQSISGNIYEYLTGVTEYIVTGNPVTGLVVDTGYVNSFGMDAVVYNRYIDSSDFSQFLACNNTYGKTNFNKIANFNRVGLSYNLDKIYPTGDQLQLYYNGLAQLSSGVEVTGDFYNSGLSVLGDYYQRDAEVISNKFFDSSGLVIYDSVTGKQFRTPDTIGVSGTIINFNYLQDNNLNINDYLIYLNGQCLVENINYDTVSTSGIEILEDRGTGYYYGFRKDSDLAIHISGAFAHTGVSKFLRSTSVLYLNGQRQELNNNYLEVSSTDFLNNSGIFAVNLDNIYNNNNLFFNL